MRLFIGLEPPLEAAEHLDERIEDVWGRVPPSLRQAVRWIPPRRWHITLAFLGEVAPRQADALRDEFADAFVGVEAIDVRCANAGALGGHVIHMGVESRGGGGEESDPLAALSAAARATARRHGVRLERRPFFPHLTVARIRGPVDVHPVVELLLDYEGPWWSVTEVALIESVLGPDPAYRTVEVATLDASFGDASPPG